MALSWTLSLTDKVSGSARRAASALDRVSTAMARARGESSRLDRSQASAARAVGATGGAARRRMSNPFTIGVDDVATGAGAGIAGLGAGAAAAAIGGAAKLGMHVQDAQAFKQRTMFALQTILKSQAAAEAAYAMAQRTALETGGNFRETMSSFNTLVAQGFDVNFADQLVRAMADLRTLNPQANLDGITRAVSQIKSTGRLQGDELMQLAEAGLNVDAVYKEIAKSLGLVEKAGEPIGQQVRKLQEAGKISSDVAIAAIMSSLKNQVGGKAFGATAAERANQTLEGAIARAKTLAEVFMTSVGVDWSPITRAIERVTAALQGPAGAAFAEKMGASLSRVVGLLDQVTESDIEAFLEGAGDAFTMFADAAERSAEFIGTVLDAYSEANAAFQDVTGMTIAQAAAEALSGSLRITEWILMSLPVAITTLLDSATTIAEEATGVGGAIVQGLVDGIEGGASAVVDALVDAVDSAISAAEEKLGIASPSRVMRDIGRMTTRGAALGMDDELPRLEAAGSALAEAPMDAGRRIGGFISMGGSGTGGQSVHIENLNAIDPAQALAEALREDLAR